MKKDFSAWNVIKQKLQSRIQGPYANARELWWCALGANIGAEIDGKQDGFQRPVLVMRVYNKDTLLVLPITNKEKSDRFHHKIQTPEKAVWAVLTQLRVISNKRLLRKIVLIAMEEFRKTREALNQFL